MRKVKVHHSYTSRTHQIPALSIYLSTDKPTEFLKREDCDLNAKFTYNKKYSTFSYRRETDRKCKKAFIIHI